MMCGVNWMAGQRGGGEDKTSTNAVYAAVYMFCIFQGAFSLHNASLFVCRIKPKEKDDSSLPLHISYDIYTCILLCLIFLLLNLHDLIKLVDYLHILAVDGVLCVCCK